MTQAYARELRIRGEAERRESGEPMLSAPGDVVLVRRGVLRSLLMRCPDGCGETLLVNLDPRAGKAWRLRIDNGGLTLYPSVWRDGGCGSHFIVWQHRILWCGLGHDYHEDAPPYDEAVERRLRQALCTDLHSAQALSEQINTNAWEVSRAGACLVAKGLARRGSGATRDWFGLPEQT